MIGGMIVGGGAHMKLKVYQMSVHVVALKPVEFVRLRTVIAAFLDSALRKDTEWSEFHERHGAKNYVFNSVRRPKDDLNLHPLQMYSFLIRTVNPDLLSYFLAVLPTHRTNEFQGITVEVTPCQFEMVDSLYSVTPVVLYREGGYWQTHMSVMDFKSSLERRIVMAYQQLYDATIPVDYSFCSGVELLNDHPIAMKYKNVTFLCDRVSIQVKPDKVSQQLAHLAMGIGLGDKTSRGFGFMYGYGLRR